MYNIFYIIGVEGVAAGARVERPVLGAAGFAHAALRPAIGRARDRREMASAGSRGVTADCLAKRANAHGAYD